MNQPSEDIKRWTARRKAAAIMEIIKGNTTAAELARSHDLTVAEIDRKRSTERLLQFCQSSSSSRSYAMRLSMV